MLIHGLDYTFEDKLVYNILLLIFQISQCVLMECTKKCLSAPKYTLQQAICSTMLNKQMFIPEKLNAAYKEALEYEERRLKVIRKKL